MLELSTEFVPEALEIMMLGMGGIFIALFILYLFSILLLKVFPEKV